MNRWGFPVTFDLNLLIPLHALLNERNVTKAAERASVGQPAMSASLAKLRRYFNDPLLVREGRGMALTPVAVSLLGPVDDIITRISDTVSLNARFEPSAQRRQFTVAASDYASIILLRPLLAELQRDSIDVELRIASLAKGFTEGLRKSQYDLVIWPPALPHEELDKFSSQLLFSDSFVAVVDRDNPDVGDVLTAKQLRTIPYVQIEAQSTTLADVRLKELHTPPNVAVTTENFTSAACLVAGTRMTTVIPKRLHATVGAPIGLRAVDLETPMPPLIEAMYWHPQNTANAANRWLREQIRRISLTLE
ncbi:LysR family transcriptional regulator [Kutzneria sp. CA-103260]|nr:LysR family transcriptional regulator [Kutzneria sp. CA-103260]